MAGLCALAIASGGVVFDVLSRPLSGSLTFFALSSCRSSAGEAEQCDGRLLSRREGCCGRSAVLKACRSSSSGVSGLHHLRL